MVCGLGRWDSFVVHFFLQWLDDRVWNLVEQFGTCQLLDILDRDPEVRPALSDTHIIWHDNSDQSRTFVHFLYIVTTPGVQNDDDLPTLSGHRDFALIADRVLFSIFSFSSFAVRTTNDVERFAVVFDQIPAVHLQLRPCFLVHMRGLWDDVRHHECSLTHLIVGAPVTVRAHVSTVKTTTGVILRRNPRKALRQFFIGEKSKAWSLTNVILGQPPTYPIRRSLAVVVRKDEKLLLH